MESQRESCSVERLCHSRQSEGCLLLSFWEYARPLLATWRNARTGTCCKGKPVPWLVLSIIHLPILSSIHPSIYSLITPSFHLFTRSSIHSSFHLSIHPSCHPFFRPSLNPSLHPADTHYVSSTWLGTVGIQRYTGQVEGAFCPQKTHINETEQQTQQSLT